MKLEPKHYAVGTAIALVAAGCWLSVCCGGLLFLGLRGNVTSAEIPEPLTADEWNAVLVSEGVGGNTSTHQVPLESEFPSQARLLAKQGTLKDYADANSVLRLQTAGFLARTRHPEDDWETYSVRVECYLTVLDAAAKSPSDLAIAEVVAQYDIFEARRNQHFGN